MTLKYFIVEIFLVVIFLSSNLFAQLKVENLKCEYKSNPLGISELKPRLSWILTSSERSQYQSSYQILVSSSIDKLNNGDGDLWDSKRQISDETISVQYGGQPLCSGSRCWWKVRVWNQDNLISDWSLPGFWSIGLLTFFDWKAGWIGYDSIPYIEDTYEKVISREAEWIWKSSDYENSDICTVYFKKNFTIDSLNSIDSAIVLMTADDKFTFYLNDSLIGKTPDNGTWNNIYKYECKKYLRQGKNKINIMVENLSKSTAGLLFDFKYKNNGKICKIVSNNTWLFSLNNNSNDSLWSKVYDIGGYSVLPWGIIDGYYRYIRMPEVIYMRKSFKAKFPVDYATIYSSAKGVYHLMINGIRASNDILSPGWTDYTKRIYYQTYDLTDKINQGDNVISVSLGDGWYSGYLGPFAMREAYGSKRYFVSKLVISYKNGLMDTIVTDNSWKISDGPIRTSDILMGENYDARLENTGWNLPAFNDKSWKNADVMSINYYVDLFSHPSEPITIVQKFTPLSISEIKPGIYIFNLNQNIAGVAQIKIKNSFPGQKIIIRYGERLNNDSSLFTKNLNNARATDIYTCKGDTIETWTPSFTYHGFQYIEVSGLNEIPDSNTIKGIAFSNNSSNNSKFECSNILVNKIHKMIYQTELMNEFDVPTDCPNRDERLGWTGDAQLIMRAACMDRDLHNFYNKWIADINYQQFDCGEYGTIAPGAVIPDYGGPGWADAGIICPWNIYDLYGDKKILELYYENMKKNINYRMSQCDSSLFPKPGYSCFGDWFHYNATTNSDLIFVSYFGHSVDLVSKMANVLGKDSDAAKFSELFKKICNTFTEKFMDSNGEMLSNTQTSYALPISFNMLNDDNMKLAGNKLAGLIEANNYKLSTGFLGTRELMLALDKINRNDLAYKILLQEELPSWGYCIKNGATSIWESWISWTKEYGFLGWNNGFTSFAHCPFGSVNQWIFENIGGIRNIEPSYKTIEIKPSFDNEIEWANVSFSSIRGEILSNYRWDSSGFTMNAKIPPNVKALIYLPVFSSDSIFESGVLAKNSKGVNFISTDNKISIYELESGNYNFESRKIVDVPGNFDSIFTDITSTIYPLPVNDIVTINNKKVVSHFSIIDLSGVEILHSDLDAKYFKIDVSKFIDGIYFLKLFQNDKSIVIYKLVKVKH